MARISGLVISTEVIGTFKGHKPVFRIYFRKYAKEWFYYTLAMNNLAMDILVRSKYKLNLQTT